MSDKLISDYVPFLVKHVVKSNSGIPKTEKELIRFCQALSKKVRKRSIQIMSN